MSRCYRCVIIAGLAIMFSVHRAHADIIFHGFSWFIDLGGFVADKDALFVHQNDHTGMGDVFIQDHAAVGGASFFSSVAITSDLTATGNALSLVLTSQLIALAAVEPGWPHGAAQAYAAIDLLGATFTISDLAYVYAGNVILEDERGALFGTGSVLEPGTYAFLDWDVAFLSTAVLGAGETELIHVEKVHALSFAVIPGPGSLGVVAMLLLTGRRRRQS